MSLGQESPWWRRIGFTVVGVGLSVALYQWHANNSSAQKAERKKNQIAWRATLDARQKAADAPLTPRILYVGNSGSQVVVLDVPSVDRFGTTTTQRCYVWRDVELRVASMACMGEADIRLDSD